MAITKKIKVVATRSFTYGTRRLEAGDEFEVMPMEARTMNALGKTRFQTAADRKAIKDKLKDAPKAAAPKVEEAPVPPAPEPAPEPVAEKVAVSDTPPASPVAAHTTKTTAKK